MQGVLMSDIISLSCSAVGYMGPFQLKKGQEIEFTAVAKRKRMSYMK